MLWNLPQAYATSRANLEEGGKLSERQPKADLKPENCRLSDPSTSSIANGGLALFNDDGNFPKSPGMFEHLLKSFVVCFDVIIDGLLTIG